jgi:hypothetical protein
MFVRAARSVLLSMPLMGFIVAGCASEPKEDSPDGLLRARLSEVGERPELRRTARSTFSPVEGLYFGELEIVAYDYRPGETVQAGDGFGSSIDWSYWLALPSGHDSARDNVLAPGEQVDFEAMSGDFVRPIESSFVDTIGAFEFDILEVFIHRTGVIYDGAYYGMNADGNGLSMHPLHKYPAWATIDDTFCMPEYPGVVPGNQDINVMFVRDDWFSVPTQVRIGAGTGGPVVESASTPLDADQESLVLSLVTHGTQRRSYRDLLFIPYGSAVTADLTGGVGSSGSIAGDVQVDVHFDLTDILAEDTDLSVPRVVYAGDASNVPFGLEMALVAAP